MASPQWKPSFQLPNNHTNHSNADNANTANSPSNRSLFSSPNNVFSSKSISNNDSSNSSGSATQGFREAGIVEKLLASYGFIQCCERQARLFFHYSQYSGNIEHLKLGDPVEFEMTYDKRTGKPIASSVVKITNEAFMAEELSTERVTGFITAELTNEREGRVAYENRGECFFLPFSKDDIEDAQKLTSKDSVTFFIGTDKSGNLRARHLRLEIPTPQRHSGVICTLKDSFGFIERSDVVKEIFFHSSECKDFKDLLLGDDVEFCIQTRNGKEVAVGVNKLSPGSVIFEDISEETFTGRITKVLERQNSHSSSRSQTSSGTSSDPFPGRIVYNKDGEDVEMSFGDRDIKGEFTLQTDDFVTFKIVTDRRDNLQHATAIDLLEETFTISNEHREHGYVASLKDYYGFIKCWNHDGTRVYFRVSELLDPNVSLKLNDELEFTMAADSSSTGRLQAIRIKLLPDGTIYTNVLSSSHQNTPKQLSNGLYPHNSGDHKPHEFESESFVKMNEFPLIDLNTDFDSERNGSASNAEQKSAKALNDGIVAKSNSWSEILSQLDIGTNLSETKSDLLTSASHYENDQIFSQPLKPLLLNGAFDEDINQNNETQSQTVPKFKKELSSKSNVPNIGFRNGIHSKNGFKYSNRGYIVALKDSYGFIEEEDGQKELFFHYSVYDGKPDTLDLGQAVEYNASLKNNKLTALSVRKAMARKQSDEAKGDALVGVVKRTVRTFNPEQSEYTGLIQVRNDDESGESAEYEFSMISLHDMSEFIQKGDAVKFKVGYNKEAEKDRAVNVKPIRTKLQGTVNCVKEHFGFLSYESNGENKSNVFFHMSEVRNNANIQPGDIVEFVILQSQRNGKFSACNVVKIGEAKITRPERLTRVKVEECGPRVVVIRNPKGPDGTKGFKDLRALNEAIGD